MAVQLTKSLREEYQRLFDTCEIRPQRQQKVETIVTNIVQNKERYQAVGTPLGIPWYFIGAIHNMESSLSFKGHLHNGDALTARTVHVPKGRPTGVPPFTWEQSATDALTFEKKLNSIADWTLPGLLFQVEKYNGFGYRNNHPDVLTPYLWSFSNHYTKGKYVADGTYDPDAVSQQCGAAVVLRRMAEQGIMRFGADGNPVSDTEVAPSGPLAAFEPMVTFSQTEVSEVVKSLQRALNAFPGIFLRVDGIPGEKTSDAFQKVTGHFLKGDPRAEAAGVGRPS